MCPPFGSPPPKFRSKYVFVLYLRVLQLRRRKQNHYATRMEATLDTPPCRKKRRLEGDSAPAPTAAAGEKEGKTESPHNGDYSILITQCIQNDFLSLLCPTGTYEILRLGNNLIVFTQSLCQIAFMLVSSIAYNFDRSKAFTPRSPGHAEAERVLGRDPETIGTISIH